MARPLLSQTLIRALSSPVEATLTDLFDENGWLEADLLDALDKLQTIFDAWDLEIDPPLGRGDLDHSRIVRARRADDPLGLTDQDIAAGEGPNIEFKETLVLDVRKHERGGKPINECASENVVLSALKTIAAFLNGTGGTLLLGVADDGTKKDLSREFPLACPKDRESFDQWELFLRRKIEQYFVDGRSITPAIDIQRVDFDGGIAARIVVGARKKLCFVRVDGVDQLYIRAGNQTLSIAYSDIEQYFALEKQYV